jgi:membrane associated rhomboid family serine protease
VPSDYRPPSAFSSVPPVVKNLLIINGLAFLAQVVIDGWPMLEGPILKWAALWPLGVPEFVPPDGRVVGAFYPWQLVTSAFLHGSIGHIAFNMFGLFMLGGPVERTLGERRFVLFYFVSVLGASLLQLAVVSAPFVAGIGTPSIGATVGASGGVLGVVTAFGMLFPRERLFIFPLPVPIEARWLVPGYAALSLYMGVSGTGGNVAHFAHLGGMVAGALLLLFWRYQQRARRLA